MALNDYQDALEINWVGEFPRDWSTKKLKYLVSTTKGYAFKSELFGDIGVPIIKTTDIKNGEIQDSNIFIDEKLEIEYKNVRLKENDILMSTVGSKAEVVNSAVGQVGKVQKKFEGALLNQNAVILRCKSVEITNEFLFYFLSNNSYRKYLDLFAHGTANQASLSLKDILDFNMPLPSINIQMQISAFLDDKTSEINSLIVDKEKLIELLEEKRQAIITEVVTKGLNPNVKMKDSGVKWIGEIPEHWNISKIKYVTAINKEVLSEKTDPNFEISYIDIGSVNSNGEIGIVELHTFENAPSRARRIVKEGDTIISTVRTYLKAITWITRPTENLICSTGFAVLTPKTKKIKPKYLAYLMRSTKYIDEIVSRSTGVSYPAISSNEIGLLECVLPPLEEQNNIVNNIDFQLSSLDMVVKEVIQQIIKLKEYRQSLIYEAVTGKIDVREYKKVLS
jgi:type I restriction enzyme, S subunit